MEPIGWAMAAMALMGAISGSEAGKAKNEQQKAANKQRKQYAAVAPWFGDTPQGMVDITDYRGQGMMSGLMSGIGIGGQVASGMGAMGYGKQPTRPLGAGEYRAPEKTASLGFGGGLGQGPSTDLYG